MLGVEETQVELGVCQEDENGVGNAEKARWCLEGSENRVSRGGSLHCTESRGWAGKEHVVSKHTPWEEGCILKVGDNELL